MSDSLIKSVQQMLIQIFRPLVRILLRLNVPFNVVSDALKWTYVDVANRHFGLNGKAPTKSRIAVITGLSRPQVDQQMKLDLINQAHVHRQWHRAGRVLTAWAEDKHYQDQYDKPLILPIESDDGPSFIELVERHSGGATYRSILDELVDSKAVRINDDGRVELIKPYYLTDNDPDDLQKIDFLALSTQYLIETIDHNIDPAREGPRFQRIVMQDQLPKSLSHIAESFIRKRSQELANEIDEYLEHLVRHSDLEEEQAVIPNLGLGIYFYKSDEQDIQYP